MYTQLNHVSASSDCVICWKVNPRGHRAQVSRTGTQSSSLSCPRSRMPCTRVQCKVCRRSVKTLLKNPGHAIRWCSLKLLSRAHSQKTNSLATRIVLLFGLPAMKQLMSLDLPGAHLKRQDLKFFKEHAVVSWVQTDGSEQEPSLLKQ